MSINLGRVGPALGGSLSTRGDVGGARTPHAGVGAQHVGLSGNPNRLAGNGAVQHRPRVQFPLRVGQQLDAASVKLATEVLNQVYSGALTLRGAHAPTQLHNAAGIASKLKDLM